MQLVLDLDLSVGIGTRIGILRREVEDSMNNADSMQIQTPERCESKRPKSQISPAKACIFCSKIVV